MKIAAHRLVNISAKDKKQELKNSVNTKLHSNPTFKGVPDTIISKADESIMNIFSQIYGKDIPSRMGKKIAKLSNEKIIKSAAKLNLEQGITSINPKSKFLSFVENIIFPFITLPLDMISWVLKRTPVFKKTADKIYRKPLLRTPRKINELGQKTSIIKGMYDKTELAVKNFAKEKNIDYDKLLKILSDPKKYPESAAIAKEGLNYIKSNLYKISNKFFDKNTGNFNTAYERPLNRIVSGLIPVIFLANDAYNLAVLCGDSKEDSKKEAKQRQKQEIARVLITAYAQLIMFGAFTKKVNTSPIFVPVAGALIVLVSEIISRLSLKKPIWFLSKEKAKNYNKKHNNNQLANQEPAKIVNESKSEGIKNKSVFSELISFTDNISSSNTSENKSEKKEEPRKALINMKTLKTAICILIGGGFIISFIKNSSLTKNSKFVQKINEIGKLIKEKIYDKLAYKNFEMPEKEYEEIIKTIKDVGCTEIAEGHELVKNKYAKKTQDGIIQIFKYTIPESKLDDVVESISSEINALGIKLNDADSKIVGETIKTAFRKNASAIEEKDYSKLIKNIIEKLKTNKLELSDDKIKKLSDTISKTVESNSQEIPVQVERKIKPLVDFVIEPFKFVLGILKKPFNIIKSVIMFSSDKIIENGMKKHNKPNAFEKALKKTVKEVLGERQAKSSNKINQNVFVNAMDIFKRETSDLRCLIKTEPHETEKIKKESLRLKRYITDAVEKSFDEVSQSSNKNTDLAMLSKVASSLVTSAFLVADNYNMVMIKSNGENKEQAKEKANERIIQRLSALFYQAMFINLFNSTFKSLYNSSLLGMALVVAPNTLTTEIVTRKSIGMPVRRKTYEQLQELDEKNENRKGLAGKYFKFMRLLTGKKPLKDRLPKDKAKVVYNNQKSAVTSSNNKASINYLEYYQKH